MGEQTKPGKAVVTVLLTNGREMPHVYDAPIPWEEGEEMIDIICNALEKRKASLLVLENPNAIYNPDYVVGVRFDLATSEEIKSITERLHRKIGFVKD